MLTADADGAVCLAIMCPVSCIVGSPSGCRAGVACVTNPVGTTVTCTANDTMAAGDLAW